MKQFHSQFPRMFGDPQFLQLDRYPKERAHTRVASALSQIVTSPSCSAMPYATSQDFWPLPFVAQRTSFIVQSDTISRRHYGRTAQNERLSSGSYFTCCGHRPILAFALQGTLLQRKNG